MQAEQCRSLRLPQIHSRGHCNGPSRRADRIATVRTRKIAFFMLATTVNYIYHLMGFSIISAETLKKIPFIPIRAELFRMENSKFYSHYVDAYAGS